MSDLSEQSILKRYSETLAVHAEQLAAMQNTLMDTRRMQLSYLHAAILGEIHISGPTSFTQKKVLHDQNWLNEFALGDITRCLGSEFEIYAGRKCPRIPNGALMLMSRIVDIQGTRGIFEGRTEITAEYDVPSESWFFSEENGFIIPVSILMEIALQPCGVLSAWMHTQLRFPDINFSFRNLDGSLKIHDYLDVRGKTINAHASLDKTVFSGSTIIQQFTCTLRCEGHTILTGQTTFGYFPEELMANQAGLDAGKSSIPWGKSPEIKNLLEKVTVSNPSNIQNKLHLIDSISFRNNSTEKQSGYVLSERKNSPSDWFYTNHFLGDPVMPGSLGVEMIIQALQNGLPYLNNNDPTDVHSSKVESLEWKYRGQVLPKTSTVTVDVTMIDTVTRPDSISYVSKANLWSDDLRIYEISNLTLTHFLKEN